MVRPFVRWIPAIVLPVAIIAAAVVVPAAADASPRLPEKSAQEVLAMIAMSSDAQYAGTVEQRSNLGFPELPSIGQGPSGSAASSALELLTGSHTVRVFVGADENVRLQVMDQLAQRDLIRSGSEAWTYDSTSNATTHVTVTEDAVAAIKDAASRDAAAREADSGTPVLPDATSTPGDLAQKLLDAIDPTTTVAVGDSARIAGRAAYTVTITPRSGDTLVASATLAVDAETGLPLSATLMALGQAEPAISIAFSSIEFGTQDPSLFTFVAPADSAVTEETITAADVMTSSDGTRPEATTDLSEPPTVIGTGWSTIVSVPASLAGMASMDASGANPDGAAGDQAEALQMLDQVTTPVAGGRVLQTSLFSIFFADDGRVLAGAVAQDALVAAAQR